MTVGAVPRPGEAEGITAAAKPLGGYTKDGSMQRAAENFVRPIVQRAYDSIAEAVRAERDDIYELRERGLRVLGDEQCCELACDGGACESCPCCCAGWCVFGHSGEIPERDLTPASNYRIWLDTAREHNPVAKLLAEIEGAADVEYDEPIAARLARDPAAAQETDR